MDGEGGGAGLHMPQLSLMSRISLKLCKELIREAYGLRLKSVTLVKKFANSQLGVGGGAEQLNELESISQPSKFD